MIYYALVEKEPDSAYGVRFPDLPGCFSAADEEADVVANAQEALGLYVSGEKHIPAPRSIQDLRTDPDVRAALADGAFLMAVPLVIADRKVRTNVMLDKDLLDTIDREAKLAGVTRSEYLAQASRDRLRRTTGAVIVQRDAKTGRIVSAADKAKKKPGSASAA